jgi:hypothetical protein
MSQKPAKTDLKPGVVPGALSPADGAQPTLEARALFERIHGGSKSRDSRDNSADDKSERKKNKKLEEQEKTTQPPDAAVSQTAMAQALAAQLAGQMYKPEQMPSGKSSALQGVEAALPTNAHLLLQARREATKIDTGVSDRIREKDQDDDKALEASDSASEAPAANGRLSFDAQLTTQAALQQLQQQTQRDNEDSSGKRNKGMLAQLIDELVECLHISERMRGDDWQIVIKLKSDILQGTQLHLENYGRRLSVKLLTNNKESFDLLYKERFELQDTLRATIDQDIDVTAEKM